MADIKRSCMTKSYCNRKLSGRSQLLERLAYQENQLDGSGIEVSLNLYYKNEGIVIDIIPSFVISECILNYNYHLFDILLISFFTFRTNFNSLYFLLSINPYLCFIL